MFKITAGKGFHIQFANGWTVSVQFGPGNYCDHYRASFLPEGNEARCGEQGSTTAEIWCWNGNKNWPEHPLAYQTPEKLAQIIAYAVSGNFPVEEDEA